jgi:hypothetical protein
MALQLYMVNKGKLESISKPVFTTGDAYVVIDEPGQMIYVWLGSLCSTDEKATAATSAQRFDQDKYKGNFKIVTYDQGSEDKSFLAKLMPIGGLKVLDKNLAKSMLKDVKTGEFAHEASHVNALYKVSSEEFNGMDAIKYVQVPFAKKSLDSDDVYIADLGVDIWVWQGKKSNAKEKAKAMSFARQFDAERAGAQRPVVFDEGIDDEKFLGIFQGKLPKSESKVQDFKPEAYEEAKKNAKKEKKGGLCAVFLGVMIFTFLLL